MRIDRDHTSMKLIAKDVTRAIDRKSFLSIPPI